jgi:hypothetical protein
MGSTAIGEIRAFKIMVLPEFPGDFALDDLREKKKGPGSF